jgi:hypothetical protein
MWGISGTVILGVHLAADAGQHVVVLNHIRDMPPSEDVVRIEGGLTGFTLWFCGPHQAGEFILY